VRAAVVIEEDKFDRTPAARFPLGRYAQPAIPTLLRAGYMRSLRFAVPLVIVLGLVGCGAGKDTTMPNVTGKKLDDAYAAIKEAGIDDKDKVKIDGGGTFGVVMESNWTVCDQSPAAGNAITGAPRLTVDRSCGDEGEEQSEKPSEDTTPEATASAKPEIPETLTAQNSKEFAAVLRVSNECDDKFKRFAEKYAEHQIAFDGSIAAMAQHGDTETRFDMLVGPGDKGVNTSTGPQFHFYDKNSLDMNLTGSKVPEYIKAGQEYRFVAQVGEYNEDTCLWRLSPVETKVR